MSRPSGVYVEGLRETVRNLERFGVEVADLKEAFVEIADQVATEGRRIVPTDSGRLAASIKPAKTKNKAVVRSGSARVPYAGVINYGWPSRGIRAADFLTGPANRNPERYAEAINDNLRRLIDRYQLGET